MASTSSSLFTRASAAYAALTEREKRLVLITTAVAAAMVLYLGSSAIGSALERRQKRVAQRREELAQLDVLREKYDDAVQAEKRSESRIRGNTASLFSVLQKNAGEVGIALNDLNERRTPVKDTEVTEVSVDLSLKELSVDKLDNLLEKIEGRRSDGVVKVTKLRVKTRFDHPEMLETGMTVSTWKSSGSTTAPAAPTGSAAPGAPRAPAGTVTP